MNLPLLLVILVTGASAEVFTAMADMLNLLGSEKSVVDVIDHYLQAEQRRLNKLKELAEEYTKQNKNALKDGAEYLSNPVNAYKVVKRLTSSWADVENLMRTNEAEDFIVNITSQRAESMVRFPEKEDLEGAAVALFRLQDVYKLTTRDIASGNMRGAVRAEPLTAQDCFLLGRTAYLKGDWYHCLMWMEEAMGQLSKETEKTADEAEILEHLAYAMYQQGNLKRALSLTKQLIRIDPDHPRAKGNLKWYDDELKQDGFKEGGSLPPVVNDRENDGGVPERASYERLCRGETNLSPGDERKLYCHYKNDRPFLKLAPLKVEILHWGPKVVVFRNVISDAEIERIKEMAYPKQCGYVAINFQYYEQGSVEGTILSQIYRQKGAWLEDSDDDVVETISKRLDMMTNLDMSTAELFQVANYGIGGHYDPHFDHSTDDEKDAFGDKLGNRIATVLFYLSDVEAGGATVFVNIELALFPTKNDAAFWHNLRQNGRGDDRTRHAACPVLSGVKWVSNKWIHERAQEFRRPCLIDRNADE